MTKKEILKDLHDFSYEHLERWGSGKIATHTTGYAIYKRICDIMDKEGASTTTDSEELV